MIGHPTVRPTRDAGEPRAVSRDDQAQGAALEIRYGFSMSALWDFLVIAIVPLLLLFLASHSDQSLWQL
jgi:hypothetical protein